MEPIIKSFDEVEAVLGKSISVFNKIIEYIRTNYDMEEVFKIYDRKDGRNELKFRKSGKTFVTFYIKEKMFTVLIIFGKKERDIFENKQEGYSQYIRDYYENTKVYHDGKWMLIDIKDKKYINDIIKLLNIKKEPNK
ncbi:MAG: DUF3788 domain-containing protein [Treponema sp.]|nr:DUF3788 domain-containing protein [Treponema sp.]